MLSYVIWLDSEKVQIYFLKASGIEKSQLKKRTIDHHTHNNKDSHIDGALEHFFHEVAQKLRGADQLLILGPGLAKNHFKSYLDTHHMQELAKKIIGIKNSDHPTDNQILATSRSFFKNYDLFGDAVKNTDL